MNLIVPITLNLIYSLGWSNCSPFRPPHTFGTGNLRYLGAYAKPVLSREGGQDRWKREAKKDANANREEPTKTHYFFSQNSAAWFTAEDDCKEHLGEYGQLLSIISQDELKEITKFIANSDDTGAVYWTRGIYDPTRNTFEFLRGISIPDWLPWEKGHPTTRTALTRISVLTTGARNTEIGLKFQTQLQTVSNRYICELRYDQTYVEACPHPNDLIIVMDASKNIPLRDYTPLQEFTNKFALAWYATTPGNRVSVITYSDAVTSLFCLNDTRLKEHDIVEKVADAAHVNQGADISLGLERAYIEVSTKSRNDVPRNLILLTGGPSSNPSETATAAKKIRSLGVRMFVVGIGKTVVQQELLTIADNPKNVYDVDRGEDLKNVMFTLGNRICN